MPRRVLESGETGSLLCLSAAVPIDDETIAWPQALMDLMYILMQNALKSTFLWRHLTLDTAFRPGASCSVVGISLSETCGSRSSF